ncbi:MAG: hypothetical protein R3200_07245 [Xanthomonadales bacterium]|nr:hypothetical protein [Xanthomonadales bacterium]
MRTHFLFNSRQLHPVWQILIAVLALGMMGALFALGLVLFAVLAVIGLVAGSVLYLRAWWLGRKMARQGQDPQVIDGEFTVIRRYRIERDHDQ